MTRIVIFFITVLAVVEDLRLLARYSYHGLLCMKTTSLGQYTVHLQLVSCLPLSQERMLATFGAWEKERYSRNSFLVVYPLSLR
jgi:hypothetical protein